MAASDWVGIGWRPATEIRIDMYIPFIVHLSDGSPLACALTIKGEADPRAWGEIVAFVGRRAAEALRIEHATPTGAPNAQPEID